MGWHCAFLGGVWQRMFPRPLAETPNLVKSPQHGRYTYGRYIVSPFLLLHERMCSSNAYTKMTAKRSSAMRMLYVGGVTVLYMLVAIRDPPLSANYRQHTHNRSTRSHRDIFNTWSHVNTLSYFICSERVMRRATILLEKDCRPVIDRISHLLLRFVSFPCRDNTRRPHLEAPFTLLCRSV